MRPEAAPKEAVPPPSITIIGAADAHGVLGRDVRSPTDEDMGRIVDVIVDRAGLVRAFLTALDAHPRSNNMTPHIPEEFSTRLNDWSPFVIMGSTMPPRDPNEDEEDEEDEDRADEPPIVREPDED
jgi:hypothetical protein